jgi:hypothetical protein
MTRERGFTSAIRLGTTGSAASAQYHPKATPCYPEHDAASYDPGPSFFLAQSRRGSHSGLDPKADRRRGDSEPGPRAGRLQSSDRSCSSASTGTRGTAAAGSGSVEFERRKFAACRRGPRPSVSRNMKCPGPG